MLREPFPKVSRHGILLANLTCGGLSQNMLEENFESGKYWPDATTYHLVPGFALVNHIFNINSLIPGSPVTHVSAVILAANVRFTARECQSMPGDLASAKSSTPPVGMGV